MIITPLLKSEKKSIISAVTNLRPEVCFKVRDARKKAGISQSALAAEIGCKQPALSMFEQGDGTKLNDEAIGKLLKKFDIKAEMVNEGETASAAIHADLKDKGYCPNPHCPSHHAYTVEGRRLLRPDREAEDPAGGRFCAICGEVLERKCPNCGGELHDGAICTFCGNPYVV